MRPTPKAIVSLYALVDLTDPVFTTATKPNPPPSASSLLTYEAVEQYIRSNAPTVSHPETALGIPS